MSLRRLYLRNSGAMVMGNAVAQPLLLLSTVLLARELGPSRFGVFSFSFTVATLAGLAAGLGTDNILIRETNHSPEHRGTLLGSAALLRLVAALLVIAIVLLAVRALGYGLEYRKALMLASPYVVITTFWYLQEAFFKSSLDMHIAASMRIGARALLLSGVLALGWLLRVMSVANAIFITTLAQAIPLLIIAPVVVRRSRPSLSAKRSFVFLLLREGWPLALTDVLVVIFLRLDVLFLSHMTSPANVGRYYAAARLAEWLGAIPMALQATALPVLSKAYSERDPSAFAKAFQTALDLLALVLVPACLLISYLAARWIRLLVGADYVSAWPALSILAWAQVAGVTYTFSTTALIALRRQKMCIILSLMAVCVAGCLSWLLIPAWGITGAAVAATVAWGSGTAWMLWSPFGRSLLGGFLRSLRLPCGGAAVMLFTLHFLMPWYMGALVSLLSYLAVIYLFRSYLHPAPPEIALFPDAPALSIRA